MKIYVILLFLLFNQTARAQNFSISITNDTPDIQSKYFFKSNSNLIQTTGRIQMVSSNPRFWQPGVYIKAGFSGTLCTIYLNDEFLYGNTNNYVEIIVDNFKPERIKTTGKRNAITIKGLVKGNHTIVVCKDTEAAQGYLELIGIKCNSLIKLPAKPARKIEFIGNSITCGYGNDTSIVACGKGQWYDHHNAWMSYAPIAARAMSAQWHLSAVSGIGLIHSCCNMKILMPRVYDKTDMKDDSISWNFNSYTPDVVTICLGQNDGVQDSTLFCNAYIQFIESVRKDYPHADIVCLTSPMADQTLRKVLENYLSSITENRVKAGDHQVHKYFFSKRYISGCEGHPSISEDKQIADELVGFIKRLKGW